ncbi:MAG: MraZ N-terminal domain-containing protein, partial [Phycisphaerales bacterium]
MLFLGHFEHTIDTKNRLAIPAELRDVFDEETHGTAFVAAPGATGSLWLWPERTFADLASELGGSLLGDEDQIDFERVIFSQSAR